MADKLDELLFSYFSGQLPQSIRLRKAELKFNNRNQDENTGGGKLENDHTKAVEMALIREEDDEELMKMTSQLEFLDVWVKCWDDNRLRVMNYRYGHRRASWDVIALLCNVDRSTAIRWRDEFKKELRKYNLC